jgi:exonuclease VII small subunit
LKKYKNEKSPTFEQLRAERQELVAKIERIEDLISSYKKYEPYIAVHKESVSLSGFKI